jgi:ABC transporter with metal-binding/Fe-S-binding domain ATP-binding protein
MFHFPNLRWTTLQARTMKIPQIVVPTEGEKEVELQDLSKALRMAKDEYSVEAIFTGALASVYQKSRVERVCSELGLQSFSPLWQVDPKVHLLNLIRDGFDVIMTGVAALGLDEGWLGRRLDAAMVDDLVELQRKYGMHAALEGGEGETFVLDCPIFGERIEITSSRKHWNGISGNLEILDARLVPKEN